MKKINTLAVVLVLLFAAAGLKAQTFPVPKWNIHIHGGYTMPLPDLKGTFPVDLQSGKNPTPYFMKAGFNFGGDVKYYVDKKSTFGIMLSLTYTTMSSGDIGIADSVYGTGTYRNNLNFFTIGTGVEYDFAPKRPANPFVNLQFTTNIISGSNSFDQSGGTIGSSSGTMGTAIRFGALFGAGVDVKLSKNVGIVLGGRYAFANLFGKDSTGASASTYGLNDKETITQKSKKLAYLQFYAGVSFYFGLAKKVAIKK